MFQVGLVNLILDLGRTGLGNLFAFGHWRLSSPMPVFLQRQSRLYPYHRFYIFVHMRPKLDKVEL